MVEAVSVLFKSQIKWSVFLVLLDLIERLNYLRGVFQNLDFR